MAIFIAWIWLDEMPTFISIMGGVIAIVGVWMLQRSRRSGSIGDVSKRKT